MARLLVLRGMAGPRPEFFAPFVSTVADVVTIVSPSGPRGEREVATLRQFGEVVVADPGQPLVDLALSSAHRHRVDGVVTFSEATLETAADVAERLGLPGHSPASVRLMQNKHDQRVALRDAGVAVPPFTTVRAEADLTSALDQVPLPAVFKPVYGAGSFLTVRVDAADDLRRAFARAMDQYAAHPLFRSRPPDFVLEGLLTGGGEWHADQRWGDYVSVESVVHGGAPVHYTVTDKLPLATGFIETGDLAPSVLPADRQDEVTKVVTQALQAVGARDGLTHVEVKLTADGPRVLEVNGRVGGPLDYLVSAASDLSLVREAAKVALGRAPQPRADFIRHALYATPAAPERPARLRQIHGLEAARAITGVRELLPAQEPGAILDRYNGPSMLYGLLVAAPTREQVCQIAQRVHETLAFDTEEVD